MTMAMTTAPTNQVLRKKANWRTLHFYQKADTLYQLTVVFCKRFLPPYGDRTVDQMIQAARSGKQNIVEGIEDGVASTEMQLKLLNVARSSIQELREDYRDYLISRNLTIWTVAHNRYSKMQEFCKIHNRVEDYQPHFDKWNNEEIANIALTLCYMVDTMLNRHLISLEKEFVTQGGIKERMHAARTGYRQQEQNELHALRQQVKLQAEEIERLQRLIKAHGITI